MNRRHNHPAAAAPIRRTCATACLMICIILGLFTPGHAGTKPKEVFKTGGDFFLPQNETVERIVIIGGKARVQGVVMDDVVAIGGEIYLEEGAVVGGDVVTVGGQVLQEEDSVVKGQISSINLPDLASTLNLLANLHMPPLSSNVLRFSSFLNFIGFLLLGVIITVLMPGAITAMTATLETHPLACLLWGTLGVVMIVPLGIILIISIAGIVLLPIEIILVVCCYLLGYMSAANLVGKRVLRAISRTAGHTAVLQTSLGLCIMYLISLIPFFGWFVVGLLAFLGFGAIIASLMSRHARITGESGAT